MKSTQKAHPPPTKIHLLKLGPLIARPSWIRRTEMDLQQRIENALKITANHLILAIVDIDVLEPFGR